MYSFGFTSQIPCATADTAALHAIKVGWEDAQHVYGRVLRNQDEMEEKLNNLLKQIKDKRWTYSINGKFYGQPGAGLNIEEIKPLAVTWIYQSGATKTLLESPTLIREASGAPLQTDILKYAAKTICELFVTCNKNNG